MGNSVAVCKNGHACENGAVCCPKCGEAVFEWRAAGGGMDVGRETAAGKAYVMAEMLLDAQKRMRKWESAQPAHNVSWNIEKFRIEWETLRETSLETEELNKKVTELAVKWFGVRKNPVREKGNL